MNIGMKILGQVISIQPLALIISLPNQLVAHVPITNISTQLTDLLENMDQDDEDAASDEEEDDGGTSKSSVPDLFEIFRPGQYVRAIVSAVHAAGATDNSGIGKTRDEIARASRRVELSLIPERVNAGIQKSDLRAGFVRTFWSTLTILPSNDSCRRYLHLLKASKITGISLTLDCKMSLVSCPSAMPKTDLLTTAKDFILAD